MMTMRTGGIMGPGATRPKPFSEPPVRDTITTRPVVIVDIDGVLADCSEALERLNVGRWDKYNRVNPEWKPNWEWYYQQEHQPIPGWIKLVNMLHGSRHYVVLLTNRPERTRGKTSSWLSKHAVEHHELRMRDGAHYNHAKEAHLKEMLGLGYAVHLAIDDDPMHIHMFTSHNIPVLYAHSGYYDVGRIDDNLDESVIGNNK